MKAASVFFLASFALIFVAYVSRKPTHMNAELDLAGVVQESSTQRASEEQVQKYREQLGEKLNRERIGIEYENTFTSRSRPLRVETAPSDPLAEPSVQSLAQQNDPVLPKSGAEAAVEYAVAEKQNFQNWTVEARQQFLRDYVANARAQGYDVRIDRDYNVQVVRGPQSVGEPERKPQSISDDLPMAKPTLSLRFMYAPFCASPND
jgi:hypothetical protein